MSGLHPYHVLFNKPIDKQLIAEIDLTKIDCRDDDAVELLYTITKEGQLKGAHLALRDRQDATSPLPVGRAAIGKQERLRHHSSRAEASRRRQRRGGRHRQRP